MPVSSAVLDILAVSTLSLKLPPRSDRGGVRGAPSAPLFFAFSISSVSFWLSSKMLARRVVCSLVAVGVLLLPWCSVTHADRSSSLSAICSSCGTNSCFSVANLTLCLDCDIMTRRSNSPGFFAAMGRSLLAAGLAVSFVSGDGVTLVGHNMS